MPWARRLVAGLSPRSPLVPSRAGPCDIRVGLCGMRKCFRRVLRLSPVTILSRRPGFYAGLADCCGVQSGTDTGLSPNAHFSFCHCLAIDIPHSSSYRIYQDFKVIKCREDPVKVVLEGRTDQRNAQINFSLFNLLLFKLLRHVSATQLEPSSGSLKSLQVTSHCNMLGY